MFVQPLSLNTYSQFGHMLNVNAFVDPNCSNYATPASIAQGLQQNGGGLPPVLRVARSQPARHQRD